jgi:hypothetical protein
MANHEGELTWDDPRLGVKREPEWIAKRRRLQSWWREHELGARPALIAGRRFPVGNQLDPADVELVPDLNFLTSAAFEHAQERARVVLEEAGTLDADRLSRNLLSSMPLCFNVFGSLRDDLPTFASLFRQAFVAEATDVRKVQCEWSPRPKRSFLDDNTAFDAAVWFTDAHGRRCLLGVEAKYTDSFSEQTYAYEQYRAATADSGWFVEGTFEQLSRSKASNQLWRNLLLAASMESDRAGNQRVDWAGIAVLCLATDHGAKKALAEVEPLLTDVGKDRLRLVTLEDLVEQASGIDATADWAETFRRRYLADPATLVAPDQTRIDRALAEAATPQD